MGSWTCAARLSDSQQRRAIFFCPFLFLLDLLLCNGKTRKQVVHGSIQFRANPQTAAASSESGFDLFWWGLLRQSTSGSVLIKIRFTGVAVLYRTRANLRERVEAGDEALAVLRLPPLLQHLKPLGSSRCFPLVRRKHGLGSLRLLLKLPVERAPRSCVKITLSEQSTADVYTNL